jgi:cytochrome c-type biogenesis protein CcmH/NrfG
MANWTLRTRKARRTPPGLPYTRSLTGVVFIGGLYLASVAATPFGKLSAQQVKMSLAQQRSEEAQALLNSGQAGAAAAFQRAIAADPNNARNYYSLAVALDQRIALREELAALQHALRLDAQYAPGHN